MVQEFQSTHPRGVRHPRLIASVNIDRFQSTHPRGVRHMPMLTMSMGAMFQSTHPRGVRREVVLPASMTTYGFNPRTREGCDSNTRWRTVAVASFQSTHPRGVRRRRPVALVATDQFQSTHPRGVRLPKNRPNVSGRASFQSTHPRGVRRWSAPHIATWHDVSIHAPARGATPARCSLLRGLASFNPRTREGCDDEDLP